MRLGGRVSRCTSRARAISSTESPVVRRAVPLGVAFAAGALVATQSRINGELAVVMGSSVDAATISFVTGFVVIFVYLATTRSGRRGVRSLLTAVLQRRLVPWQLIGGFLGAYAVWAQSLAVPVIGVALFTVAVVAGQTSNSLVVDRWGLGAMGRIPVTSRRISAAVVGLLAVAVAVWPRLSGTSPAVLALSVSLAAGVLLAIQQALNGAVAKATSSSWTATGVNFALGAGALSITVMILALLGQPFHVADLPASPLLYLGGPIGLLFIAGAAWAVPVLGVLRFGLLSIAGQLSGAVLWDVVAPTTGAIVSVHLIVGMLLAFVAVVVSAQRGPSRG